MAQEIDITGLKKNFNTTVVGASVTVITQYNVRTAEQQTRFYYFKDRVFEFGNRPVWGENINSFITPLVIATPSFRPLLYGTSTNNAVLVTGQSVLRAGTSTQVNSANTASLFVKGAYPIRVPINSLSGGVATVNTFTDIPGQPNIYGVALITTATWAFAIEQLPLAQTSGLSVNSIITATTSSGNTGNFGTGNTAYVYAINSNNIIVVATSGTSAPVDGTITGIAPTGQTFVVATVSPLSATYLIVGGGGGGGSDMGGGGGAGGYLAGSGLVLANGTYPITVGGGGPGAPAGTSGPRGTNGDPSIAFGFTAFGGGGGASKHDSASYPAGNGSSGGGGSGGRFSSGSYGGSPGTGTAGQGNNGASSGVTWYPGGGGGAGAAASQTGSEISHGGVGISNSILGSAYFWAGGGGGAGYSNFGGNGGSGGGGGGAPRGGSTGLGGTGLNSGANATSGSTNGQTNVPGGDAGANTGGGGGGGSHYNSNNKGGNGGSGIVVVRYSGSQRATGGTVTTVGGDTVHAFTATGLSSFIVGTSGPTFPTFRDPVPSEWVFTVTNLSTVGYNIGDIISSVGRTGRLGAENNLIYLTGINTASNAISGLSFGYTSPKVGNINAVYPTGESLANTVVSNVSTSSPYTFIVSGLTSTSGLIAGSPGSVITATNAGGSFGAGNTVIVRAIIGYTSLLAYVTSGTSVPIPGIVTNFTATGATASTPPVGQAEFTATGTFSWIAPTGITSVNVVAVGGGGGGGQTWSAGGGGAGGLGWKNNIAVTPGNSYTVVVGAGGPSLASPATAGSEGGTSYFISTGTVAGYGSGRGGPNSTGGTAGFGGGYFGDGGGRGGNGNNAQFGGAGAGGYTGQGGNSSAAGGSAGSGGGGASGGYYSSTHGSPGGGGVGILGQGADGTANGTTAGGGGGSGGANGSPGEGGGASTSVKGTITGGAYGGGGGGSGTSTGGGAGGRGAVRIIWGAGRSFPATLTADQGGVPTLPTITTSFKNQSVGGPSVLYPTNLIDSDPYVYTLNVAPRITPVLISDLRRLVLQPTTIQKTGYSSLRYNTVVEITQATTSQYFSTGTLSLSWPRSVTPEIDTLPIAIRQNTVPKQVLVNVNSSIRSAIKTYIHVPTSLTNSNDYESAPSDTRVVNPASTGTYIYGVTTISTTSWAFRVHNLSTSTVASLTSGTIITANTNSNSTGNFGVGNIVSVYSTGSTSIIAITTGSSNAPVAGSIDSISISGSGAFGYLTQGGGLSVDCLLVAGGGGGGVGGGGGAGGVLAVSTVLPGNKTYTITVGAGGPPVYTTAGILNINGNGGNSSIAATEFTTITAIGGGSGATSFTGNGGGAVALNETSYKGANGGSGGGSGGNSWLGNQVVPAGLGVYPGSAYLSQSRQGYDGGTGAGAGGSPSGGGGGAGGPGGAALGAGGIGITTAIIPSTLATTLGIGQVSGGQAYFGGGGGGGSFGAGGASGGLGGGGQGTQGSTAAGAGTDRTGGGGGGNSGSGGTAGRGGSGVVVIRYAGSQIATGGITTSSFGYTYHSFTSTVTTSLVLGFAMPNIPDKQIQGIQSAFVAVVPVSSATSYSKNRNFTARLQSTTGLPNNLGTIKDITPSSVSGLPGPWTFTLSAMHTTAGFSTGSVITSSALSGSFGANNTVRVLSITSSTEMVCVARSGDISPTTGTVAYIQPTGAIELGPVISTVTPVSLNVWSFVVSNLTSTTMMQVGSVIVATTSSSSTGSFGTGTVYVSSINNISQIVAVSTGSNRAPVAGIVDSVTTSGAVLIVNTGTYQTLTFIANPANLAITNNGTTDVTIFKNASNNSWNTEARVAQAFTAPCTLEFFKQAGATDNNVSYAQMGWNEDPLTDASYTSMDYAAYPYQYNSYFVANAGVDINTGIPWDPAKKFYIVYTTDGFIKHYNHSTLLFSTFYGIGKTVYIDSSFYSANATFGGFSNIRVKNAAWLGSIEYGTGSSDYSIVRTGPNVGQQDNWDNIVSHVNVNTLNRPDNYFGNEVTEPTTVMIISTATSKRNTAVPMFESGVNPGNITNITTVTTSTWSFTINGMRSTSGFTTGTIIFALAVVGSFGQGNQVTVTGVTSSTAMTCITSFGTKSPLAGSITGIYATGEIEPASPYIERVVGVSQLSNTTSYSVSFNSQYSSYLQYPSSTQFNLVGGAWTIECWLKPTGDYLDNRTIFVKRVTGTSTTSYQGYLRASTGVIGFYNGTEYNSGYTLTPNVWSHCAWVYTGSILNIYVNGVVRYSVEIGLGANNTEPLVIGVSRGYADYFSGLISNLRLVKNLAVYTGNFTPPTSPLSITQTDGTNIAAISTGTFTSLLVCQTNAFIDRSVYSTATTVVGTPVISIENPFGSTPTIVGPWSYVISGLVGTTAFFGGAIITATTVGGNLGNVGTGTSYVSYVINNRQIAVINNTVGATVTPGAITAISTSGVQSNVGAPASVYQVAFNGSNQYLTTPTAPFAFGGNNFTVEAWVNLNAMPTSDAWPTNFSLHMMLATVGSPSAGDGIGFLIGQTKLLIQNNDTQYAGTAHGMSINTWYHLAYVRNGNNFYFYVNGVAKGSVAFSGNVGSGSTGYIGCETGQGAFLNGRISNLRIVKNTAVYTSDFSTPTVEPSNITDTALIICRSATFIDVSTNAVTVTPVNSPVISIGTLVLSPQLGSFPASNYTATVVYPDDMGSRVIVGSKTAGASFTYKSFDTETPTGITQRTGINGKGYGNNVNWATFTTNSPYAEGELTGSETTLPFTIYTRDVNTNYGKKQWFVPTPMNLIRGQVVSTSTVVVAIAGTSTYTRSTSTNSINAFVITPTTRITRTPIIVSNDPNGIATVGTVSGSGPWTFDITGLTSVTGFTTGTIISSIGRIGNAGAPGNPANVTYVTAVNTNSITCGSYGSITPVAGIINSVYATGEILPSTKIANVTTITGSSWFFNITGLRGTTGLVASAGSGTIITITTTSGSTGTVGSVGGNSLVVVSVDSLEQIKVYAYGGTTPFAGTITSITSSTLGSYPLQGDSEFITPGTYSWTAPLGVTSVSVVAVGGGGAGHNSWANAAGAGAGLGWKNNIAVTPGQSYTVQVGAGGVKNGGVGGNSFFINLTTVAGYGGGNATSGANSSGPNANGYGGGYVGEGGGAGGNATNYAGGGGAGGYSGSGGNAQGLPGASSGGAAGGGYYSSTYGSGAGGGVGIYGRGETASGWWHGSSGQVFSTSASNGGGGAGGSGGTRGRSGENPTNSTGESGNVDGYGGEYGGGGGGPGTSWPNASGSGGKGAVRIIWGTGRIFPATNTSAVTSVVTATVLPSRSSLIGGPVVNWETPGITTNYMQHPTSIGIDRPAQLVVATYISSDAAIIKAFYTNSGTAGGGRSITNTLIGSENFFVDGSSTGTNLTSQTAYWI